MCNKPETFFKNKYVIQNSNTTKIISICGFFNRGGNITKYKTIFSIICKNINLFVYGNFNFIYSNYTNIVWMLENIFEKKLNYQNVFGGLVDLLKPPFVIKSVLVSKKLKKKTKIKYDIKIVYKRDDKRVNNTLKQIYYNSNSYTDNSVKIRLYKSLLFLLLD